MTIPTNKLGILIAEIDSGGALRSAGDRVILGNRKSKTEQEWIIRQKVGECSNRIQESVHRHTGIVARLAAESVFATFPSAQDALDAACEILRVHAHESKKDLESTNAAPLGLRIGITYGKMLVDAGVVSGDAIYLAGQIASRANTGQLVAAESLVNALGDRIQGKVKSLGSARFGDLQTEVETFEVNWNGAAAKKALDDTVDNPAPIKHEPRLTIESRGKEIVLDKKRPSVTLRSGKEREPHIRLELREGLFYLVNLRDGGTRIRNEQQEETLCTEELQLEGRGAISLGKDFTPNSPEVLRFTAH